MLTKFVLLLAKSELLKNFQVFALFQNLTGLENDVQWLHDSFGEGHIDHTFEMLASFQFFVEDWKTDVSEKGQSMSLIVQKYFLFDDMR